MTRYLLGRLAQAALVLWGAYTVTYLILYSLPSDPLSLMLNAAGIDPQSLSAADLARAKARYGLDRSFFAEYGIRLWAALHGDFGESLTAGVRVWPLIASRLTETAKLGVTAVFFSISMGVGFATLVSRVSVPWLRSPLEQLPSLGFSIPMFWLGLLLIQLFAFRLGWLPSSGAAGFSSLILPAITLGLPGAAVYAQVLLRGFRTIWSQPFVTTALAKGLSQGEVLSRHVFRNAMLPVLTLFGLQVGHIVSGAVIVEVVFARPGLGHLAQEAVLRQDVPIVLAAVSVSAAAFVTVNLITDLLYPLFDPRIALAPRVS